MALHYHPTEAALYPLNAIAHSFAKQLDGLAELGWEITAEGDSDDAWRIRVADAQVRARCDQWAVVRLIDDRWSVAEVRWTSLRDPAGQAPWERLRALADQLEREAAS